MGKSKTDAASRCDSDVDDDLDDLITDSLNDIRPSQKTSQFSNLHSQLIKSAAVKEIKLTNSANGTAAWKEANEIETAQSSCPLYNPNIETAPSLNRSKQIAENNLGKGWFNIEPAVMTDDLKRDIKIIQMRNYLDSKRFYKNPDRTGKVLHVGTVVGGFADSKSSRLTNKERKQSILDEVLADKKIKQYSKDKYLAIQKEKSNKRKTFKKSTSSKKSW